MTELKPVTFHPIGHVENGFEGRAHPEEIAALESRIVLKPELTPALDGLEAGDQLMVIFYFHLSRGFELRQHPRGDLSRPARGVFSLRSPDRPNPIGVTTVDLLAIEGPVLRVRGLDALNGTPVLDLKRA
jgi:tRNA-Thr(GGU) m(6)t(6)A37 methyltransferase TsaA